MIPSPIVPARLLLIEDDPRLADMVRDYLSQAGYRVTHAASGSAGCSFLRASRSTPSSSI